VRIVTSLVSALLWVSSMTFFVVFASIFLVVSLLLPRRAARPLARFTCRVALVLAGQRLYVVGQLPDVAAAPYVYLFNHTSILDAPVLMCTIPEFFGAVGKAEQFSIPGWGRLVSCWGVIPLERSNLENAIRSLDAAGDELASGLSLLISPEGTRSRDGRLLPFKKGAFHVALQHKRPLIPVVIRGAYEGKSIGSWLLRPGTVRVEFGPPIRPEEGETVDEIRDRAEEYFRNSLDR
jgi:1-acyl-sn-glycerol-3-phosphate acyltransferase